MTTIRTALFGLACGLVAVVIEAAQVYTIKEVPNPVTPGRPVDRVSGINDAGQVVGTTRLINGTVPFRAFLWTASTGFKGLGTFDRDDLSTYSTASGINVT